jgi:protease IV
MRSFFKIFFASFLALVVFAVIVFFLAVGMVTSLATKDKPKVAEKSVLVLNLGQHFSEKHMENPLGMLSSDETDIPGLYDVVRLIRHARNDKNIAGIYIKANGNNNGYAASEELRNALMEFRESKKFVIAYGDMMSQGAYLVASAADRVYANPVGSVDWSGFNMDVAFVKGTLDKLKIEPQIFYAGKFKSATEPFRTNKMSPENRIQTTEWLGDLYRHFLGRVSKSRGIDTATLQRLANTGAIQTPQDAANNKLIDGLKYDDQVKDEIKKHLKLDKYDKINYISINTYSEAANFRQSGSSRIALIYAEGNIIDGKGDKENIGSEDYVKLIRKARLDKSIKAVVFRINSGGGSALASENIWRELALTKQEKPLVVSFSDVAASGGYYIASAADSIFALPNTITGSIGVFGIIPNMQGFFNEKLGVTFDGVKTANYADAGAVYRPLSTQEKGFVQASIDRIYTQFKQRVAEGRKKDTAYIDSIAQGRVWSGEDALRLGLVDRLGGLQQAVESAARMAKLKDYRLREYPERKSWLNELLGKTTTEPAARIKEQLGADNFRIYQEMLQLKQMVGVPQARLPFTFIIH